MIFDLIIHLVPKSWVQKGEGGGQKVSFSCFKTACTERTFGLRKILINCKIALYLKKWEVYLGSAVAL